MMITLARALSMVLALAALAVTQAAPQPLTTLQGRAVDWQQLRSKTVLVAFFSVRMQRAAECLQAIEQVHAERGAANLEVLAVSIDSDHEAEVRAFVRDQGLSVPVLLDADGRMRADYGPTSMPHAYFFAEQGRYLGDLPGFPEGGSPTPVAFYSNLLRRAVGLELAVENDPARTPWPAMPAFTLPGGETSTALAGAPYVLTFVAAECDKCRAQLELFGTLQREFAATPLRWIAVLVSDVDPQEFARERGLPFPVFADGDGALRRTLHYRGFVPDTLLVDGQGRIRYRHTVFDDEQPPLYRMELRALTGRPNAPILKPSGPSGVRRCAVCHEREYFDWQASGHAHALRSLQAIGRADDPECVRCHVVGWQQPGGYDADRGARAEYLADVQCESCHGTGGPHLAPAAAAGKRVTAAACAACHDEKHSLGFDFDRFVQLVDHRGDLRTASPAQRAAAAAQRQQRRRELLEPDGAYVGAAACRPCHAAQFASWQETPHARAFAQLSAAQQGDAACVHCHATGSQRRWADGEPPLAAAVTHGVQCESCHGPGQRHVAVATAAERRATIVGLGARCEECVVRQICTNCHDRQNDPDFDFAKALPAVRQRCLPAPR